MLRHLCVAAAALAALCVLAAPALAHEGNPNYRSEVDAISPPVEGLDAEILNFDDRIELRNTGGETIVVEGYRGEPYLRFEPDGTVAVNQRSPATYLNEDRFAAGGGARHGRPEGRARVADGRPQRPLRLARPPHPLDVVDAARARPQGRVRAHEGVRLEAAAHGQRQRGDDQRDASPGSARTAAASRWPRRFRSPSRCSAGVALVAVVRRRRRRSREQEKGEAW